MAAEIFPQYLSAPYQVLWWETDEVAIMVFSYTVSSTFGKFFELSFFALVTWAILLVPYFVYNYYKSKYPSGFFKHMLYFLGLKRVPHYPSYFIHDFSE